MNTPFQYTINFIPTGNGIGHFQAIMDDGSIISADTEEELFRFLNENTEKSL